MTQIHKWQETREKTSIVVSHKIHTVRRADIILFMQKGKVHEKGTHEELIAAGGAYTALWEKEMS
jgi:ABC-type multidrug transport system fused ATPase/permease subunit